jgi:hypothetical protein
MSEERITVKFPEGQLIADFEIFLRDQGCTLTRGVEHGVAYLNVTFPVGTTRTPIMPQPMEPRFWITFPNGTQIREIYLRGRGSGPQYSQLLRSEET